MTSAPPEVHPTHSPEPDDAPRLYASGIACRRCGWFVAFDETAASGARITKRGIDPCPGPMRISLRDATPVTAAQPIPPDTRRTL